MIEINDRMIKFDREIYAVKSPYYITYDKFWDGGYQSDASLLEKSEFYHVARLFSDFVKEYISLLDESIIIGSKFSQKEKIFEIWKDKNKYDSFNNLNEYIKKRKTYKIALPKDDKIIDYIIENDFRYLSCIDLYLPKNKIVLQPTCHSEIFVYCKEYHNILPDLKRAVNNTILSLKKYSVD